MSAEGSSQVPAGHLPHLLSELLRNSAAGAFPQYLQTHLEHDGLMNAGTSAEVSVGREMPPAGLATLPPSLRKPPVML